MNLKGNTSLCLRCWILWRTRWPWVCWAFWLTVNIKPSHINQIKTTGIHGERGCDEQFDSLVLDTSVCVWVCWSFSLPWVEIKGKNNIWCATMWRTTLYFPSSLHRKDEMTLWVKDRACGSGLMRRRRHVPSTNKSRPLDSRNEPICYAVVSAATGARYLSILLAVGCPNSVQDT